MAAYVLPLYVPPRSAAAISPPQATLLERVFPGVPTWWVGSRLGCLLVGGLCIAWGVGEWSARKRTPVSFQPGDSSVPPNRTLLRLAFAFSALQATAGLWATSFPRWLQLAYLAGLAIAPAAVWCASAPRESAERCRANGPGDASSRWSVIAVAAVIVLWMVLRIPGTWHDIRVADMPDTTIELEVLERSTLPTFNLLTDGLFPGVTAIHRVPEGAGWIDRLGLPVPFYWIQGVQILWLLVSAGVLAWVAATGISATAAPVATAAFLFSPMSLCVPLLSVPLPLGSAYTAILVALALTIHRRRSLTALAAFGVVTGVAASHPGTAPTAGLMWIAVLWSIRRTPEAFPWEVCGIAMLSFAAMLVPAVHAAPDLLTLAIATGQWAAIEAGLSGQLRPSLVELTTYIGEPLAPDNPLGALLAPFAIPRTAVRLWGDTLFEPVATVLATVGLLWSVRAARSSSAARWLLALLAATLLPGVISSYDRPSLIRFLALSVPMALLTAVGFELLRHVVVQRDRRWLAAALTAAAIVVSGIAVFDVVNPSILSRTAFAIALESIQEQRPCPRAVLLRPWIWRSWRLDIPLEQVPDCPIRVIDYEGPATLERQSEATPDVIFWVPGQEEEDQISAVACRLWPAALLHTLVDPVNASKVFAVTPSGSRWAPALTADRHTVSACGATLETEATKAQEAMNRAEELLTHGQQSEALAALRDAAPSVLFQSHLYETLARRLLEQPSATPAEVRQAVYWARRASLTTQEQDPQSLRTLAAAYATAGRLGDALDAAARARQASMKRDDAVLAGQIDGDIARYRALTLHSAPATTDAHR